MDFTSLTKKEAPPKKVKVITTDEPGEPFRFPIFKKFEAKMKDTGDGSVIYTVHDIISQRVVMNWRGHNRVDDQVKAYINRCYGRKETIFTF